MVVWFSGSTRGFQYTSGGENCPGDQNLQGVLLWAVLERCELSAISQGTLPSGPVYTYCSGEARTTLDYILMDVSAASIMDSCCTHPMDDLNTLDHLPLTVSLLYDVCSTTESGNKTP